MRAELRKYTIKEFDQWRAMAKLEQSSDEEPLKMRRKDLERWPHQVDCLESCVDFLNNQHQRDFFVQMATGSGKSLVMADVLAKLGEGHRACIIVPKLDLMEQLAKLLEEIGLMPSRVGTGWPPDREANIFVCVQNSAWKLSEMKFDLVILDEAHHYEPLPKSKCSNVLEVEDADSGNAGIYTLQVLSLHTPKRIFLHSNSSKKPA